MLLRRKAPTPAADATEKEKEEEASKEEEANKEEEAIQEEEASKKESEEQQNKEEADDSSNQSSPTEEVPTEASPMKKEKEAKEAGSLDGKDEARPVPEKMNPEELVQEEPDVEMEGDDIFGSPTEDVAMPPKAEAP